MNTDQSHEDKKGASQAPEKQGSLQGKIWTILLVAAASFLLVAIVGGYAFNWAWTGFQGNTLWDWFKLLLLPIVLGTAKLSFKGHQKQWAIVLGVAAGALLLVGVGGYLLNWGWTGFQGNTLWDWLILLLIPVALAAAKLSYAEYQSQLKKKKEKEQLASVQA